LGGAVAVHVAASNQIKSLVGLVVIDVVEGTALASLEHMHLILQRRPSHFASEEEAIEWR
jgi:protein phosphatase methylesterase 1